MSGRKKLGRIVGVVLVALAMIGATAAASSAAEIGEAAQSVLKAVDWT